MAASTASYSRPRKPAGRSDHDRNAESIGRMQVDDVCEVEIDGIGTLSNPIVAMPERRSGAKVDDTVALRGAQLLPNQIGRARVALHDI